MQFTSVCHFCMIFFCNTIPLDTPSQLSLLLWFKTNHLGKLTFAIMQKNVEKIITVTDQELIDEMKFFGERMKMIVEPTGCLALAGLRSMVKIGEIPKGSNCGVVISGGTVDLDRYCKLISSTSS